MKKLFSKIAAAMIGLFTVCAPIYAEVGRIYIGNRQAFSFCGTPEKKGSKKLSASRFLIKGNVNGKYVEHIFLIDDPNEPLYNQEILMYNTEDIPAVGKGINRKFYNYLCKKSVMTSQFRCVKINCLGKPECVETEAVPIAEIVDAGRDGQDRIARAYNPNTRRNEVLFKLEYYDMGRRTLLNDYETRFHTGAYIKRQDGSIVGRIEGKYLPPCVVLYLVLIGAIKL